MKQLPTVFAALLLSAGSAFAQVPPPSSPADRIPPSESNPGARPLNPATTPPPAGSAEKVGQGSSNVAFDQADTNSDGKLTASELDAAQVAGVTLAQLDNNGDGKVTRAEWNRYYNQQQSSLDSNDKY